MKVMKQDHDQGTQMEPEHLNETVGKLGKITTKESWRMNIRMTQSSKRKQCTCEGQIKEMHQKRKKRHMKIFS